MKKFCIRAAAGTERFEGERARTGLAKMGKEQRHENGFTDAGVSAGDENDSRLAISFHKRLAPTKWFKASGLARWFARHLPKARTTRENWPPKLSDNEVSSL